MLELLETKHHKFIKNDLNRILRIECDDSWYKFKAKHLKGKSSNEMLSFYCIEESDFIMLDYSTGDNMDLVFKSYLDNRTKFTILLENTTENIQLNNRVKTMKGLRFHSLHNKGLVQAYFDMYETWYLNNGGNPEFLLANYHVNVLRTYIIKRTGGFLIVYDDIYDKDNWYSSHNKDTKTIEIYFKTMYRRRLIKCLFKNANRISFPLFINTHSYPNALVLRILKKQTWVLVNGAETSRELSINQAQQLRALVELGREDLLALANTSKKNFTHEKTLSLFPLRSKATKEKLRNKKINEKNKFTIEEYSEDSFMESIWNQFFIEEVDSV